jgi:hypothetical protein
MFLAVALTATLVASEASAQWVCTAHSQYGNHGWGSNTSRNAAARRALYECGIRGGGCYLTSCTLNGVRRGYRCPSGWCD